jgi:hypothetical protein
MAFADITEDNIQDLLTNKNSKETKMLEGGGATGCDTDTKVELRKISEKYHFRIDQWHRINSLEICIKYNIKVINIQDLLTNKNSKETKRQVDRAVRIFRNFLLNDNVTTELESLSKSELNEHLRTKL